MFTGQFSVWGWKVHESGFPPKRAFGWKSRTVPAYSGFHPDFSSREDSAVRAVRFPRHRNMRGWASWSTPPSFDGPDHQQTQPHMFLKIQIPLLAHATNWKITDGVLKFRYGLATPLHEIKIKSTTC